MKAFQVTLRADQGPVQELVCDTIRAVAILGDRIAQLAQRVTGRPITRTRTDLAPDSSSLELEYQYEDGLTFATVTAVQIEIPDPEKIEVGGFVIAQTEEWNAMAPQWQSVYVQLLQRLANKQYPPGMPVKKTS